MRVVLTAIEDKTAFCLLSNLDMAELRGYDVMAIVLCAMILAAMVMCYFTWKLRYKIVLRVVGNNNIPSFGTL